MTATQEWAEATKLAQHNMIDYQTTVRKHRATGVYEAEVKIYYPVNLGGNLIVDSRELERLFNKSAPFTVNPISLCGGDCLAGFAQGNIDAIMQKYNDGEENIMQEIKPKTNATKAQLRAMRKETERLVGNFTPAGLVRITGKRFSAATVRGWKLRGRVSAQWSHEICKNEVIKGAGFTRESLRPDVAVWTVD